MSGVQFNQSIVNAAIGQWRQV